MPSQRPFSPAPSELRHGQVVLFAAVAVPGLLLTALGIVSLALHRLAADVVLGILTLAFAMWVIVGGFAAWLLVRRSEQKTRLQHDFVSNVSHELRTPLTGIRVLVETLKLGRVDAKESQRCFELLEAETARLSALVEEVLEFGRIEAGGRRVELERIPVDAVIDGALRDFEVQRVGASVELQRVVAPDLVVTADRRALGEVIVNLLSNAVKYGGEGKTIWIRAVAAPPDQVHLSVEDQGPGVPLAMRRKIFQPFFRGDDEMTRGKPGTGLGLAIASRLVAAQHGSIRVEGRPGGGSRFVVVLPGRVASAAAAEARA